MNFSSNRTRGLVWRCFQSETCVDHNPPPAGPHVTEKVGERTRGRELKGAIYTERERGQSREGINTHLASQVLPQEAQWRQLSCVISNPTPLMSAPLPIPAPVPAISRPAGLAMERVK